MTTTEWLNRPNGSTVAGWLRLLTLRPDGPRLDVRTFSPHFLATGHDPWRRGIDHSSTVILDPA